MTGGRVIGVAGLLLAAVLVPAGPAHAAITVTNVGGVVTVTSDGAGDQMVFTCVSGDLLLNGAAMSPAASCGVDLVVNGGGGDDVIDTKAIVNSIDDVTLDGGAGNDEISGGDPTNPSNSVVNATGGADDDLMHFTGGDSIAGGDGDDTFIFFDSFHSPQLVLQGQGGTDTYSVDLSGVALGLNLSPLDGGMAVSISGGPAQVVPWGGIEVVDMVLASGADTVNAGAFSGRALVDSGGGEDSLEGGDGPDNLNGGSGDDTVEGGDGPDVLNGGTGDDVLRARDSAKDTVACGSNTDIAVIDPVDTTSGCEVIDAAADKVKPKPTFSAAKVKGSKLKLKADCPATELRCVGEAALTATGKRNGAKRSVKLGDIVILVDRGRKDRLTVRLTSAQRASLAGLTSSKLKIKYDVMDAAGNVAKGTASIKLKLP